MENSASDVKNFEGTPEQKITFENRKMEALRVMASGVAHEVNNPLSIIYLKLQEIRSDLCETPIDVEKINLSATKIENMVSRISKTIQDTLAFARGTAGDSVTPVDLFKIISEAIESCKDKLPQSKAKFYTDFQELKDLMVECRPNQILEVFTHLFKNAQEAIAERPEQWITVKIINHPDRAEIRVIDAGEGIPASIQEKILDPFFTTKKAGKGVGLGLSIAKTMIDLHQGSLVLDNQEKNTCFVVSLPKVFSAKS